VTEGKEINKHVSGLQGRYDFNQRTICFLSPSSYLQNPRQKNAFSQNTEESF